MRRNNPGRRRLWAALSLFVALIAATTAATATLAARSDGAPQPLPVERSAPLPQAAQPDAELTTALIAQDWSKVADLLGSDPSMTPAKQFVQAHAFTALNQANASMCAFLTVSSDENIASWRGWAQSFQASHPQDAVADYLLGDALARQGDLPGAIDRFTAGLQLDPTHQLLLNARGTAYALQGNRQAARQDLFSAAGGANPLVAAQVGAGSLIIDRKGGPTDARTWFDSALSGSQPDDALALYGRALTWVADGSWEKANADLQSALEAAPCIAPLVTTQLTTLQEYMAGSAAPADQEDADTGFALTRVIEPFLMNPSDQNAAALLAYLAPNPQDVPVATQILRSYGASHPLWAGTASQQLNQVQAANTYLQPTYQTLSTIPSSTTVQSYPYTQFNPYAQYYPYTQSYPAANSIIVGASVPSTQNLASAQLAGTLRDAVGPGLTPGGFDAGLYVARFDRGDWPAVTYYGLLYPTAGQALP